jgi:hypothetical protein
MKLASASALLLLVAAAAALAAPTAALREAGPGGTTIDWSAGRLVAEGAAAADLRAPGPDVARVSAERRAREQALATLDAAARKLPLAGGGTVGEAVKRDEAAGKRLAAALARARTIDASYASDGGARVTVALPLEAVRLAVAPPAAAPAASDGAPTAILVDARKAGAKPVLGVTLVAGKTEAALPATWWTTPEAAAADARAGATVARATAGKATAGKLEIDLPEADLARAAAAGALVIVVVGGGQP